MENSPVDVLMRWRFVAWDPIEVVKSMLQSFVKCVIIYQCCSTLENSNFEVIAYANENQKNDDVYYYKTFIINMYYLKGKHWMIAT